MTQDLARDRDTERALQENEERFRFLFENNPTMYFTVDPEGTILSVNRYGAEHLGYSADELTGRSVLAVIHEEDREAARRNLVACGRSVGRVSRWDLRKMHRDGHIVWVQEMVRPVRTADGDLMILIVCDDITELKRAEEERERLRAHEAQAAGERARLHAEADAAHAEVRRILERITDAFFALDREWRFTHVNRGAQEVIHRLLGADPGLVIGLSFWDVVQQFRGTIFEERYRRAMATQQPEHFEAHAEPFSVWFEVHAYPSPEGLSVFFRDVTERKEVERALRESEERYRVLADMIPQPIWTADPDGRTTYFSRRWYQYTGTTPEQTLGDAWGRQLHPEDAERTVERWRDSVRTGEPYLSEARYRSADGEYHWFLGQAMPQRNEEGTIVRWFGTLTYIDHQKRAEETQRYLAEASRVLASSLDYEETLRRVARLAVSTVADCCLIDVLDEQGRIRRFEVAHRDPARQSLSRRVRDQALDPTEAGGIPEVIRTGTAKLIRDLSTTWLTTALKAEDALQDLAAEQGIQSVIIVPMRARGRTLGAITLITGESGRRYDETDLARAEILAERAAMFVDNALLYREAEQARAEAEQRVREEQALREAVAAVGASFTTEDVIRQIAISAEDATGADGAFVTSIHPERDEVNVVALAGDTPSPLEHAIPYRSSYTGRVIAAREPMVVERVAELQGPGLVPDVIRDYADWSLLIIPLISEKRPIGALFLLREPDKPRFSRDEIARARTFGELAILAFRRLEMLEEAQGHSKELERITESRARLMRGFSHDVKNPLGAADGYAQLLEEGILGALTEDQQRSVERIRRAIRTSLDLIQDLLELARAEAGQLELEHVPTDVAAAARDVTEDFRAQAEGAGITLEVRAPESLSLRTDPTRVRQVLANLISNAVKYAPKSRVAITAEVRGAGAPFHRGPCVAISVADTGPGIPAEKQEHIFQEFTRLAPGGQHGAGVGLAISRRIARLLGGDIVVVSEEGRGATFTLVLPTLESRHAAQTPDVSGG